MNLPALNRRRFLSGAIAASAFLTTGRSFARSAGSWAAIAYSQRHCRAHMVWNGGDQDAIHRTALAALNADDGKVAISGAGSWIALSHTGRGGYGTGRGNTLHAAIQQAQQNCAAQNRGNQGTVIAAVYGAPGGVDFQVRYDPDFTAPQRNLLEAAVHAARFLMGTPQVMSRINAIAHKHFYFHELVGKSFIGDYTPDPDRMTNLMNIQLFYLSWIHHPRVTLNAYYEDANYWARAPVGRVLAPYGARDASDIRGEFEVKVNTKWLASSGDGSNTFVWAGVLAHEYMHNLGHMHGEDEYGEHLQINAVQRLVYTMGEYKKGQVCPDFACDCRKLWR